jgi:hypothetical protein
MGQAGTSGTKSQNEVGNMEADQSQIPSPQILEKDPALCVIFKCRVPSETCEDKKCRI